MQDLQQQYEKLLADVADCELVSNLTQDIHKRATFRRLAEQYKELAEKLRRDIDARKLRGNRD